MTMVRFVTDMEASEFARDHDKHPFSSDAQNFKNGCKPFDDNE